MVHCLMISDIKRILSPRSILLVLFGLLAIQGAVVVVIRFTTSEFTDIIHPSIHFVSGLIGIGLYHRPFFLFRYGIAFGIGYFLLGVFGILGIIDHPLFPLGIVDHAFHIIFSGIVLVSATAGIQLHPDSASTDTQ